MKTDECPRYADERAGDHARHRAYDLALEPVGPGKAIEQQTGERADGEDDQKCNGRSEGHVRVLLIVVLERVSRPPSPAAHSRARYPVRSSTPGPVLKARLPPSGRLPRFPAASAIGISPPTGYPRFSTRRSTHGSRHCEVVQFAKRLRVHSAARWRPGRVRPYLGGRTGGSELAQRRTAARVRD